MKNQPWNGFRRRRSLLVIALFALHAAAHPAWAASPIAMERKLDFEIGGALGQFRAAPIELGRNAPRAFVAAYSEEPNIDPDHPNLRFPKDTLKLMVFDESGKIHWRRDLGPGVMPGIWFAPVLPFDLDGDGTDEIWFLNNTDARRPFAPAGYRLERLNARTGVTTGYWPWPRPNQDQRVGRLFRNFILGGHANGKPVLLTAQGTYGPMALQAFHPDMKSRWSYSIAADAPGARGSHMTPVIDIDHDGVDELLWGERIIRMDTGKEVVCADRDVWANHSDVILPLHDRNANRYYIFTAREKDLTVSPRVVLFDDAGRRQWGDVEFGHMHRGWLARVGLEQTPVAMAMRTTPGRPPEPFFYEAFTGRSFAIDPRLHSARPSDLTGDGGHEFLLASEKLEVPEVTNRSNYSIVTLPGKISTAAKLLNYPGEHVLAFTAQGRVTIWVNAKAVDTPLAKARYAHPYYRLNRTFTAVGYNHSLLGGI